MKASPVQRTYIRFIILIVVSLVVVSLGCSSDEEAPEPTQKPTENPLVGSWEVIRFNGESLEEYFSTPEEEIKAEVTENELVFASDGWFAQKMGLIFIGDLGDGVTLTLSITASIKGKYTVDGQRLSQVIEDVSVELSPIKTWEQVGVSEEALENELRKDLLESGTWSLSGTTLTFTGNDGETTVLRKR